MIAVALAAALVASLGTIMVVKNPGKNQEQCHRDDTGDKTEKDTGEATGKNISENTGDVTWSSLHYTIAYHSFLKTSYFSKDKCFTPLMLLITVVLENVLQVCSINL